MANGRKLKQPDPAKLARFYELCERMDLDSAAMASGLKRSTCWRWFEFGEEHSDDDLEEIADPEEREKVRFQVEFWETTARALTAGTDRATRTLERAQVGSRIDRDPETGEEVETRGSDMVALTAAQFHLRHRVPAYSDKLKVGGIAPADGGDPLRLEHSMDDKTRAALVSMREHYESLKNPK